MRKKRCKATLEGDVAGDTVCEPDSGTAAENELVWKHAPAMGPVLHREVLKLKMSHFSSHLTSARSKNAKKVVRFSVVRPACFAPMVEHRVSICGA